MIIRQRLITITDRTIFRINSVVVNPKFSWWSYTMSDAGLLSATLCSVAMYAGVVFGIDTSKEVEFYQKQAIEAITSKLDRGIGTSSSSPEHELLIGTVATVASFDVQ